MAGAVMVVAGGSAALLSSFLPWFDGYDRGNLSEWEALGGGDIVLTLLELLVIAAGIVLLFLAEDVVRVVALCVSWLLATATVSLIASASTSYRVGPYLAAFFALTAAAGATVLWRDAELRRREPAPPGAPVPAPPTAHGASTAAAPPPPPPSPPPAPAPAPQAGWYADPAGSSARRYWDGANWTSDTSA